jgi:hypothetical protein
VNSLCLNLFKLTLQSKAEVLRVGGYVKDTTFIASRGKQNADCYEFCQAVPFRPSPKGNAEMRRSLGRKEGGGEGDRECGIYLWVGSFSSIQEEKIGHSVFKNLSFLYDSFKINLYGVICAPHLYNTKKHAKIF